MEPTPRPPAATLPDPGQRAAKPAPTRWQRLQRLSFQQMLLLAFLCIAGLLGASSLRALLTLEQLMVQHREGVAQATALAAAAQSLTQRGQMLERAARQSLVLGDAQLRQNFDDMAREARGLLADLGAGGLDRVLLSAWQDRIERVQGLLRAPGAFSLDAERAVAEEFVALDAASLAIEQATTALNRERSGALQERVETSRQQVTQQVVGVFVMALALALALGVWLARPFKRLERAIRQLGENRLDIPVDIEGPADVRRLGQRLEWLRLRLVELDADKARFLRHVSHELKTPLAALREGVSLLQEDGVVGTLNPGQREVAQILEQNTRVLQDEIEALLRFNAAAFEARQLQRQDTDLLALLERQVEAQRLQWQGRGVAVHVRGQPLVLPVDADKLGSALGNLLSNAIRFSPAHSTIEIALYRHGTEVRIDITDQGPGVAMADRARIFEPFYRGERQPEDAVRGTGIGLSIVQEYVTAHGGRVTLGDEEGPSLFRITLPHAA